MSEQHKEQINRLIQIMEQLRNPDGGCPWDLEQDHKSIRQYLLEETYEVIEAINNEDVEHIKEELGDLLLQVVFHAQIAKDNGQFDVFDVAKEISDKMVRRHPHVFGEKEVNDAGEVLKNWDEIKKAEKAKKGKIEESILDSIAKGLPALQENYKISKKVAKLGFDWKKPEDVFDKIQEEMTEVKEVLNKDKNLLEEELGDLLFATANLCRVYDVNPEVALQKANQKFKKRFLKVETKIKDEALEPKEINFNQWDQLWQRAKKES